MKNFETRLKGGHPNSLGNTIEIVEEVLRDNTLFEELFSCYYCDDEIVRLRTSNAIKRLCKEKKSLLLPYIDRLLDEISQIDQASTQWTLSTLFDMLENDMDSLQKEKATDIMKNNLVNHDDWIVLNTTMATLGDWSTSDHQLKSWLLPHLERLSTERRKSVANRAKKLLKSLT